jgi:DNA-binding PadR family transcriptional regulator
MPLSDLVLYSIFSLQNQKIETNFENIVVESFELFPQKFSMQIYTEYPDPNRVRRELQRMDGKGFQVGDEQYVEGNLKTTYKFTDKGLKRLTQIQTQLKTGKKEKSQIKSKVKDSRGKIGRVLNEVEKNPLFKKFLLEGENIEVSEPLIRDLLFATMETSDEKLRNNMKSLIEYCDAANREDLKAFLTQICKKFSKIF